MKYRSYRLRQIHRGKDIANDCRIYNALRRQGKAKVRERRDCFQGDPNPPQSFFHTAWLPQNARKSLP